MHFHIGERLVVRRQRNRPHRPDDIVANKRSRRNRFSLMLLATNTRGPHEPVWAVLRKPNVAVRTVGRHDYQGQSINGHEASRAKCLRPCSSAWPKRSPMRSAKA